MSAKPMTGRKALAILLGAFGVIVAANLAMLAAATGSFPGLVVKNSYVASQGWNARTDAQRALGWRAAVARDGAVLRVTLADAAGAPLRGLEVTAVVGRPATARDDMRLPLTEDAGAYVAPVAMGPGLWRVAIVATSPDGARFEAGAEVFVGEPG